MPWAALSIKLNWFPAQRFLTLYQSIHRKYISIYTYCSQLIYLHTELFNKSLAHFPKRDDVNINEKRINFFVTLCLDFNRTGYRFPGTKLFHIIRWIKTERRKTSSILPELASIASYSDSCNSCIDLHKSKACTVMCNIAIQFPVFNAHKNIYIKDICKFVCIFILQTW